MKPRLLVLLWLRAVECRTCWRHKQKIRGTKYLRPTVSFCCLRVGCSSSFEYFSSSLRCQGHCLRSPKTRRRREQLLRGRETPCSHFEGTHAIAGPVALGHSMGFFRLRLGLTIMQSQRSKGSALCSHKTKIIPSKNPWEKMFATFGNFSASFLVL